MEATADSKIDVTKTFKMIMLEKDLKQYEVGQKIGIKDRQPFNRMLQKNDELRIHEVIKIAEGLCCDVRLSFIDKESGKEWLCEMVK